MQDRQEHPTPKNGIPRGLARTGPVLLSYGFRPFFLGAAVWAVLVMALWLASLSGALVIASAYGPPAWHAHEMLFGFAPAVLTGYLMTVIPQWTGRFPLSGRPLAALFTLWCLGRITLLASDLTGPVFAMAVDAAFLPLVAILCAREIVTGRKWRDMKLVAALGTLAAANAAFHISLTTGAGAGMAERLAIAVYLLLISMVGGRIVPSFTRGHLKARPGASQPAPFGAFDRISVALGFPALAAWAIIPDGRITATLAAIAAAAHGVRLVRWRGWQATSDPLLLAMHGAYGLLALGFAAMAGGALSLLPDLSVMHILTVGAMAGMMLTVMMRATRNHTGKIAQGGRNTALIGLCLLAAALLRPLAEFWPGDPTALYLAAGTGWMMAFALFLIEYGPLLLFVQREPRAARPAQPARPR